MMPGALTPSAPWQAVQFSAMKAPCSALPAAILSSVAPVQATKVGVRSGG